VFEGWCVDFNCVLDLLALMFGYFIGVVVKGGWTCLLLVLKDGVGLSEKTFTSL